jgi:hypothetical protein
MYVYVVTENGEVYPAAYSTYESALSAVQKKYPEEYEESKEEDTAHELYGVKENKSGTTKLYIEKGIHIVVSKLPVKVEAGRLRKTRKMRLR